ncbi:MAG: type II toxin-antitoxin system VapB family antitoxin [Deltaproteobacteria bacterium]|nr:type II toxin-antitoxin system VapB family antitoxin [Deltaproteobacteria bacterium]
MRTTLDLDDRLLARARKVAGERGTTLTAIIEEALAALLSPRPKGTEPFKLAWRPQAGHAPPEVDIADRQALYDLMDKG